MAYEARYQFWATLRSETDPVLGVSMVYFPIPWKEYDKVLERLKFFGIGGREQDCYVDSVRGGYPILERLEGTMVNLDELDYLAKRLDSFDVGEAVQFQATAAAEGITTVQDLINLTFCCQGVTVVQDFKDLKQIGRDHLMALGGGSVSAEELHAADLQKIAMELLQSGEGKVTPYGVVYQNGMELIPCYHQGCPFPAYWCGEPLVVAVGTKEDENFLFLPMAESRLRRELERYPIVPENLPISYIDQAEPEEIISSLQLEREDIFSLNRLAQNLDGLSQEDAQKLKAAMYLTDPHSSGEIISLVEKLQQFDIILRSRTMALNTLRLYMPLHAELYQNCRYDDPHNMDGSDLIDYEREIAAALEGYRVPGEAERGLMEYYPETDNVSVKVRSVVFQAENRGDQLWCVAECRLIGALTPKELNLLKEYITDQASDGWGDSFGQQKIETKTGELYVHLWSHMDWDILTEEERFGQQQKMGGGMTLGQSF